MTGALCAAAGPALAQPQGLALDRFEPAPAGDRFFGVPSPYAAGDLTPHVMLLVDYAHNPLVLKTVPAGTNVGSVVKNQLYMNLDGGLSLWSRLFLDIDVPVAVAQSGDSPTDTGSVTPTTFTSPHSAQFGDLRLGARVRIWGEYHDPFQIAVGGYVWFPTGAKNSFVSTGQVRGLPQLIVGGRAKERVVWTAALGPEIQASQSFAGVGQGTSFRWGAGVGVLLLENRHLQIGPEIAGDVVLRDVQKRTTNAELLVDVRYRVIDDLELAIGAGPGLTSGIGTPDFRGVFSIAYTPEQLLDRDHDGIPDRNDACPDEPGVRSSDPAKNGCPFRDRDGDGIPDDVDACPDDKGLPSDDPKKNGCPDRDGDGIIDKEDACPDVKGVPDPDPKKNGCPADRDGDGIPDVEDACPDVKGVRDPDPKKNGCPPDRDGDGIPDAEDACPDVKGVRDPDPKKNGCPPDRDGDGVPDAEDACPDVPGIKTNDPKTNGCPEKTVTFTEKEIFILEQVQFDVNKATIKPVSNKLLDEVAGVMKEHPEILKLEVQGHTDNTGSAAWNKTLSGQRAEAVRKALVARKIQDKRMTSKGYGQDKPVADNGTDEGRSKNRRVQFIILEKADKQPAPPGPKPKP